MTETEPPDWATNLPPEPLPPANAGPPVNDTPVPPPPPPPSLAPVLGSRSVTPTPVEYGTGSVKQDPETLAVAVRTNILDPDNRKDWGIMSIDRGGMHGNWDQVSSWPDLAV